MVVVAQSALAIAQNLTGFILYSLTSNISKGQSHCDNTVILTYGLNGFCDAHLALKTYLFDG